MVQYSVDCMMCYPYCDSIAPDKCSLADFLPLQVRYVLRFMAEVAVWTPHLLRRDLHSLISLEPKKDHFVSGEGVCESIGSGKCSLAYFLPSHISSKLPSSPCTFSIELRTVSSWSYSTKGCHKNMLETLFPYCSNLWNFVFSFYIILGLVTIVNIALLFSRSFLPHQYIFEL